MEKPPRQIKYIHECMQYDSKKQIHLGQVAAIKGGPRCPQLERHFLDMHNCKGKAGKSRASFAKAAISRHFANCRESMCSHLNRISHVAWRILDRDEESFTRFERIMEQVRTNILNECPFSQH